MDSPGPSHESIRAQLKKVLASRTFARADSLNRLLRYLVEHAILSPGENLKEYRIGTEAFGRGDSFDPHSDPIVRVQARRLRTKLEEYYKSDGQSDAVVIDLPKGAYTPTFAERTAEPASPPSSRRKLITLAASALAGSAAGAWLLLDSRRRKSGESRSIAVLPLKNLSRDSGHEYFADGLTEALITDLSMITSLRVLSRTSAMTFKNTHKTVPEIAREVKVDSVVEGSVTQSGDKVRITVQLIDAASDRHLWAETYERDLGDVLKLQSEVARKIAMEIRVKLTASEADRLAAARRVHPDVLHPYLEARYYAGLVMPDALNKSIQLFQRAIDKDPGYAPAHAGQAFSHIFLCGHAVAPHQGMPKAKAAALKALQLDDSLAEAHAALGWVNLQYEWDWRVAEERIRRSLQLNPSSPLAHQLSALYFTVMNQHDKAVAEVLRSQELDPASLFTQAFVQMIYFGAGDFGRAVEVGRRVLDREPKYALGQALTGMAYQRKGLHREAMEHLQTAARLDENGYLGMTMALGYAVLGQKDEALRRTERILALSKGRYICAYEVAATYAALGDPDRAFEWFRKAVEDRSECMVWVKVSPWLDPVRADPRFETLLNQIGFKV